MQIVRPVGRQAASRKYDLLTALGAYACRGDKHFQRLVLRFITLIVARYNWQSDEIMVGQREMAAMWSVDERTVKREVAKLRALGWLVQKRAAVRGRVAVHGLDLSAILSATSDTWEAVGPDFVERMRGPEVATAEPTNVVAFPGVTAPPADGSLWSRAQSRLMSEDPALYAAWFRQLASVGATGGVIELTAPTRFHATFVITHHLSRILAALRREDASIHAVTIASD
ncbi:hypothetical protein HYN69_18530 (plasmid) [Gemmobacter aquarius]|uniref:DnaA N-terminal domain-containing protein n=1 Tax=Paragemmobacter aquarius TaxID=2169400 RepID=A0A2S0US05_9RHOB|nr:DnaA N-terminal domain-containing protein [Gemmobacter aquarius]AWB50598.1 hypothetical protein HYN69_18530 [Gemmobacter aquarius]